MPKRGNKKKIERWILRNVGIFPKDIAAVAEGKFGVSRSYINAILKELVSARKLEAEGKTRARQYALVEAVTEAEFALDGSVDEDRAWRDAVEPALQGLGKHAKESLHYGFTEMMNNSLDHSAGRFVKIKTKVTPAQAVVEIDDDGVGIFKKIRDALNLDDEEHAVLELSKGKLTTDPESHTGEGIFFTSRACDRFVIRSGSLNFSHDRTHGDWLIEQRPALNGTRVVLTLDPDTRRPLRAVFDQFTTGDEYDFDVTHVPVALAQVGEDNLISRSQAKRLLSRVSAFRRVILDFGGVPTIGQAFADEIFRVFSNANPEIQIVPVRANDRVLEMIGRALAARRNQTTNGQHTAAGP